MLLLFTEEGEVNRSFKSSSWKLHYLVSLDFLVWSNIAEEVIFLILVPDWIATLLNRLPNFRLRVELHALVFSVEVPVIKILLPKQTKPVHNAEDNWHV